MNDALKLRDVSKIYRLYARESDRLWELFSSRKRHRDFKAVEKISFRLEKGETLGIVGVNGAGKSTLLKLIAGVIEPTRGTIERYGKVTALLELGTGFNLELTGRENVFFNGMLVGMSKKRLEERFSEIVAFSELGDFIDEPLKTYSSGMVMRLAFSIAIHTEPAILIVDEALSVGDAHFSAKCVRALHTLKTEKTSIIYVSHDLNSLKLLCDRLILLDHGKMKAEGSPETIVNLYNRLIARLDEGENPLDFLHRQSNYGTLEAMILKAEVRGECSDTYLLASGETARVIVQVEVKEKVEGMTLGMMIRDRFGQDIYGTNTHHLGIVLDPEPGLYRMSFVFPLNLGIGHYSVTLALHKGQNHIEGCIHWVDDAASFEINSVDGSHFAGLCRLPTRFEMQRESENDDETT